MPTIEGRIVVGSTIIKILINASTATYTPSLVSLSTGFGTGGATYEDVKLMKSVVGDNAKVKASGGVRDKETAQKYVDLGAERLGTSSGIEIVK